MCTVGKRKFHGGFATSSSSSISGQIYVHAYSMSHPRALFFPSGVSLGLGLGAALTTFACTSFFVVLHFDAGNERVITQTGKKLSLHKVE